MKVVKDGDLSPEEAARIKRLGTTKLGIFTPPLYALVRRYLRIFVRIFTDFRTPSPSPLAYVLNGCPPSVCVYMNGFCHIWEIGD